MVWLDIVFVASSLVELAELAVLGPAGQCGQAVTWSATLQLLSPGASITENTAKGKNRL
jgi:hypothetical protein